ncbi:MAG: ligase-associated DNA damage response DEXH box helicase [Pirellulales bacterium]|nr:ligase-associated DNA damage response DEXH box helicase [Pirellulales bacterium]
MKPAAKPKRSPAPQRQPPARPPTPFLVAEWFAARGWRPFAFQLAAWQAFLDGESGLIHAATGMGKSYAAWLGIIEEYLQEEQAAARITGGEIPDQPLFSTSKHTATTPHIDQDCPTEEKQSRETTEPLRALWITPMRALANDLVGTLQEPVAYWQLPWSVELRTGDTTQTMRKKQRARLPSALVTTPESLSLLLSYPEAPQLFKTLRAVVVDEWHELLGTKRGVQTELCLARLRRWLPGLRTWGLSATLANLELARYVLLGVPSDSDPLQTRAAAIISGETDKSLAIETILPEDIERFPWAGHLGLKLLPRVVAQIEEARSSLVFTNTRSQCEIWFSAILHARPDWAGSMALHHGSLDRELREYVEARLRGGDFKCVVCTSSLDLGVDFSPVDQVLQVGSPKGIARLLQRAGRSGHQPGATSRVICVPTHAFELVEYAAARQSAEIRDLEGREPLDRPLDVLVQHLITIAISTGFAPEELLAEVRTTYAYRQLTDEEWQWALDFAVRGGQSLQAYPQFAKLVQVNGRYVAANPQVARLQRMTIGTISSEASLVVKLMSGATLGTIEEGFIARLRPGDHFVFAGRPLEFVILRDMAVYCKKSKRQEGVVPRWDGGRFPLSTQMARAVRRQFDLARAGDFSSPELACVRPILELQRSWSILPGPRELLIERAKVREGHQLFFYPFEGRAVNEGIASLVAYRISRETPCSITITPNDYGVELLSNIPLDYLAEQWQKLFSTAELEEDLLACLNVSELAKRQFRDIARVAGLVVTGYPGASKTAKQLQASTSLIYDVFREYDPQNMLLQQARREVLLQQLEIERMRAALARMTQANLVIQFCPRLTPLAFPLWAARIQTTKLSTEKWSQRVERMVVQLEKAAGR